MARYRVGITPRGTTDEIDVSNRIHQIGNISSTIDAADFLVGVSSIDSVRVTLLSPDQLLSMDGIFKQGIGRSRVSIYIDDHVLFRGLISDEGTKFTDNTASLLVVSPVNELKNITLESFNLSEGQQCSAIIRSILRSRGARGVFGTLDIRPEIDFIADAPFELFGKSTLDALNELLLLSNSFLLVDHDFNVKVSGRVDSDTSMKTFFGPYDPRKRTPSILKIEDFNSGVHRTLNRVILGEDDDGVVAVDSAFIEEYGVKEKQLDSTIVSKRDEKLRITKNILESFKRPKIEFKITVPTDDVFDVTIGDIVKVDYPKKVLTREKPTRRYGQTQYDDGRYSTEGGVLRITPALDFIIYERHDKPRDFTTQLKLRET